MYKMSSASFLIVVAFLLCFGIDAAKMPPKHCPTTTTSTTDIDTTTTENPTTTPKYPYDQETCDQWCEDEYGVYPYGNCVAGKGCVCVIDTIFPPEPTTTEESSSPNPSTETPTEPPCDFDSCHAQCPPITFGSWDTNEQKCYCAIV